MSSAEPYRALHEAAGLVDRSSRGRLTLGGGDRRSYLQGLLTNDIVALTAGHGCYAAYLTPQGRMIADMRVFELGDALLVDLDAALAAPVADRWSQLIFSEDVQVEDVSARTAQVGVYGPMAAQALVNAFAAGPSPSVRLLDTMAVHDVTRWDVRGGPAYVLCSDDIGLPGFDVVVPVDERAGLESRLLSGGAVAVDADTVETCRVEAGRPLFGVDMNEDTIPLEAGVEDRAISLTKGCYVGQEVVIRVLHRGHGRVAKKLVKLVFDEGSPVPPRGATLHAGDREIGTITSASCSPALHHAVALGYVHRDFVEPGTVVEWRGPGGASAARVSGASA